MPDELTDDQLDHLDMYRDPAVRAALTYQERQRAANARDIEMVERILAGAELDADEGEVMANEHEAPEYTAWRAAKAGGNGPSAIYDTQERPAAWTKRSAADMYGVRTYGRGNFDVEKCPGGRCPMKDHE